MTLKEFQQQSRMQSTIKTVLVGVLCVLIGEYFHLDDPYFSVLLSFLLMTAFKGKVFRASLKALLATIIFGFISVLIGLVFFDSSILYLLLSCLLIFIAVLLVPLLDIGAIIAGIVSSIILFFTVFNGVEASTETYYLLCTQFFITFVVASIVDSFVLPFKSYEALRLTIDSTFASLSAHFKNLNAVISKKPESEKEINLDTFNQMKELIRISDIKNAQANEYNYLVKVAIFTKEIYVKNEIVRNILLEDNSEWMTPEIAEIVKTMNTDISGALNIIHESWISGGKNDVFISEELTNSLHSSIGNLEEIYRKVHSEPGREPLYYEKLLSFGSLIELYKIVVLKLHKIDALVRKSKDPLFKHDAVSDIKEIRKTELIPDYKHLLLHKGNVRQAVKIIIITLIVLFGELYMKWPGGFQVTFFSVLFGLLPNIGQVHHKARISIQAVFVSILYGFVCLAVLSQVQSFILLILFFILGGIIFSYLANGTGSSSYGWLHALLIVPFSLLVTNVGVVDDLASAIQRGLALIVVACVGIAVQHLIWPVIPERQLRSSLNKSLISTTVILEELLRMDVTKSVEVKRLVRKQSEFLPAINTLFNDAKYLLSSEDENTHEYFNIIERVEFLYIQVESLFRGIYKHLDNRLLPLHLAHMKKNYDQLFDCIKEIARQFEDGTVLEYDFEKFTVELIENRQRFRDSEIWKKFSDNEIEHSVFIAKSIDEIIDTAVKINEAINTINAYKDEKAEFVPGESAVMPVK